jgi:predicted aminopeptidase
VTRRALLAAATLPALSACASLGEWAYRLRQFHGHVDLLNRARPVDAWLADPATPEATRHALQLALRLRAFAVRALALPDNTSYLRYAALPPEAQGHVVWNVVAAPAHSLKPRTWCAPVMGCVAYRGHHDRTRAEAQAAALRAEGWDIYVYGVPAYSTLGWSNAFGGDPLLSSFLHWREDDLARLLFHELAHQRAYAKQAADDTGFNESYATAVERLGVAAWQRAQGRSTEATPEDVAREQRRERWRALALAARADLAALYAQAPADVAVLKRARFQQLQDDIAALAAADAGYSGYLAWARQANNAHLALLSAYQSQVPAFEALFHRLGGDWRAFHAEVARQAALPPSQRSI